MRARALDPVRAGCTIRAALAAGRALLADTDRPDLDAQLLLMRALGVERAYLFAQGERGLSADEASEYTQSLARRAEGEPFAYISGRKGFFDIELEVSRSVLIPRPETELLVEAALRETADTRTIAAAEIGTGSGAIAITLSRRLPQVQVYATEISPEALDLARRNAWRCGGDVSFFPGDLALPLIERGIKVDLLLANLPYIRSEELQNLAVSRWEPRLALDGGADGLRLIDRLLGQLPSVCQPGARVLLEIGADQGEAARALIRRRLHRDSEILRDYARLDRIASFRMG